LIQSILKIGKKKGKGKIIIMKEGKNYNNNSLMNIINNLINSQTPIFLKIKVKRKAITIISTILTILMIKILHNNVK